MRFDAPNTNMSTVSIVKTKMGVEAYTLSGDQMANPIFLVNESPQFDSWFGMGQATTSKAVCGRHPAEKGE